MTESVFHLLLLGEPDDEDWLLPFEDNTLEHQLEILGEYWPECFLDPWWDKN